MYGPLARAAFWLTGVTVGVFLSVAAVLTIDWALTGFTMAGALLGAL